MKKLFFTLFFCTCIIGIAVIAGSPYYKAYQLNQAYKADNGKSIADSIDYAQLQYNLSNQLITRLDETLEQRPILSKLTGSALQIGEPFIKTAVNGTITPNNIETAINSKGQVNESTKQLAVAWAIATDKIDFSRLLTSVFTQQADIETIIKNQIETKLAEQQVIKAQNRKDDPEVSLNYCGFSCFKITGEIKGYPLTVKMQRQGLIVWKITDVVLP